jgi:hypothetical protein
MVQAQQMMIQNNHKLPKDLERRPSVVLAKPTASPVVPLTSSRSRYSQQTVHEQSSLERLGVYRRKVIRYRYIEPEEMSSNRKSHRKDIIYEADAIHCFGRQLALACLSPNHICMAGCVPTCHLSYGSNREFCESLNTRPECSRPSGSVQLWSCASFLERVRRIHFASCKP